MKTKTILLIHLLIWLVLYAVIYVTYNIFISAWELQWILSGKLILLITLMLLPAVILPFYAFYFLWYGLVAARYKLIWYITGLLVLMILPVAYLKSDDQEITADLYLKCLVLAGFFSLLGFLFRSFLNEIAKRKELQVMQQQQLQHELNYLKAQMNPHFLFNTINNIDALIQTDPASASDALIRLAEIMRYMIYDTAERFVPLKKELDYLNDVIALYRLRYKEEREISFTVNGDPLDYMIPPMLLLPVIENAFKHHSLKHSRQGIGISISIQENRLQLNCINPYDTAAQKPARSGFGLETLKRQLDLLFPDQYNLDIRRDLPIFKADLSIPLTIA